MSANLRICFEINKVKMFFLMSGCGGYEHTFYDGSRRRCFRNRIDVYLYSGLKWEERVKNRAKKCFR